jgi:exopolysaccharide production protein ExoZ
MVVFAHLKVPIPWINDSPTAPLSHGQAGVDMFFLISGFIMAHGVIESPSTPSAFMRRRILRITPLYWLVTVAVFAMALIAPHLFPQVSADALHLLQSLFFIPQEKSPVVYVGWTLNYEMFFYCLFAVGLLAAGPWRLLVPMALIVGLVVLGLVFGPHHGPIWYVVTNPMLVEFAGGIVLAVVWRRLGGLAELWAILMAAAFAAIFIGPYVGAPWIRVGAWGVPAACVATAALALEARGLTARWRPVQLLGDASYSIYLTHFFVTRLYEKFPVGVDLHRHPVAAALVGIVMLVVVAGVGIAVHKLIEKPLGAQLGRWWPAQTSRIALAPAE